MYVYKFLYSLLGNQKISFIAVWQQRYALFKKENK